MKDEPLQVRADQREDGSIVTVVGSGPLKGIDVTPPHVPNPLKARETGHSLVDSPGVPPSARHRASRARTSR